MTKINDKIPYLYCFLDTNILLHFQTFNEVDWPKILNAKQVCLVLAPIVLRELEKHKDDYNNERRRNRARMLLSKLKPLFETEAFSEKLPQVRKNVELLALIDEPQIDWGVERLDQTVDDDRLLASVISFSRQETSAQILLLTEDFPLRLKAKSRGIQTRTAEQLVTHIEPPTAADMKIRMLEQQVKELKDRMPELRAGFYENGDVVDHIIRTRNSTWIWQTPDAYAQDIISDKRLSLDQMVARANLSVGQDKVQEYIESYEAYLSKLGPALKMKFIKEYSPYCILELTVINEGTASAHEVNITFKFPNGSSIIAMDDLDTEVKIDTSMPDEPEMPIWARPPAPMLGHGISLSKITGFGQVADFTRLTGSLVNTHFLSQELIYSTAGFYRNRYDFDDFPFGENILKDKTVKLLHHMRLTMKPIRVYLPPSAFQEFAISYSLLVEELTDPLTGSLKVRWE